MRRPKRNQHANSLAWVAYCRDDRVTSIRTGSDESMPFQSAWASGVWLSLRTLCFLTLNCSRLESTRIEFATPLWRVGLLHEKTPMQVSDNASPRRAMQPTSRKSPSIEPANDSSEPLRDWRLPPSDVPNSWSRDERRLLTYAGMGCNPTVSPVPLEREDFCR